MSIEICNSPLLNSRIHHPFHLVECRAGIWRKPVLASPNKDGKWMCITSHTGEILSWTLWDIVIKLYSMLSECGWLLGGPSHLYLYSSYVWNVPSFRWNMGNKIWQTTYKLASSPKVLLGWYDHIPISKWSNELKTRHIPIPPCTLESLECLQFLSYSDMISQNHGSKTYSDTFQFHVNISQH